MDDRKFQRREENFICKHCSTSVRGNGYTNHCPKCLWGKHVDVNPGDRMARCGGMMEPIGAGVLSGGYVIVHRCVQCGAARKNKAAEEDNFDLIMELSKNPVAG